MASRISHRDWRNSFSLSRLMVTRSRGTAIIVSTERMIEAMTNSMSVKPRWDFGLRPRWKRDSFIVVSFCSAPDLEAALLLNGYGCLRSVHRNGLQTGIACSAPGDRQGRLAARLRLKSYGDHRSLPGDSTRSRRPRGGYLESSGRFIFTMHQGYRLPVLRKESSVGYVHQL